jgi:3-dehydroquinate synthase
MSNVFTSPYKISKSLKLSDIPPARWIILVDRKVDPKISLLKKKYPSIKLSAGEGLKEFSSLERLAKQIIRHEEKHGRIEGIVSVGGGSLGDTAGFLASIYRRGIRLIHIPTTYLSVIDSAFGGKTAVNAGGAKNQLGTFYPAEKVLIIKDILPTDFSKVEEAWAELFKISLLDLKLWKKLSKVSKINAKDFWTLVPYAINLKQKIVQLDPQEKKGLRKFLNLGHTIGHALEAASSLSGDPLSHGHAVALGIYLENEFLYDQKCMSQKSFHEIKNLWERHFSLESLLHKGKLQWSRSLFRKLLLKDKKNTSSKVQLIALSHLGVPHIKEFDSDQIIDFLWSQWLKSHRAL